jgi:pyruvate/2-oxoglutarate dehydrogenase complex dihydrolipoamide acyltransferase (E2) component
MTAAKTSTVVRQPNCGREVPRRGKRYGASQPGHQRDGGDGAAGAHAHGAGEDGEAGFVQASGQRHADQRPHEVELPKLRHLAQQRQQDAGDGGRAGKHGRAEAPVDEAAGERGQSAAESSTQMVKAPVSSALVQPGSASHCTSRAGKA